MKNYLIAPSILSADFANLGQDTQKVLDAGADMIHFDVMDNHFVPNLTMGPMFCQALRNYGINAPIDIHLMVSRTEELIIAFAKSGANHISIHPESTLHLDRALQLIRDQGCTAGIVLNPATPLGHLDYIMDKVDLILLMSVNPGFGGQAFIPSTIEKLKAVKQRINHSGFDIRLQVDGGVKVDNIADIAKAGADIFVAGSAIFDQPDYHSVINAMREQLSKVDIL